MALADDLLAVADDLEVLEARTAREATRRRAVSTAYYALFHLLVSEAVANWQRAEHRPFLARMFDHGPMSKAADAKTSELNAYFKTNPPAGPERDLARSLHTVASAFTAAQQARFDADYNIGKEVTETMMVIQIETVREAFYCWKAIRDEPEAQMFLLTLLATKRTAEKEAKPKKPSEGKKPKPKRRG